MRAYRDGCRSRPLLACWPVSGPSDWCCFPTLTLLFQFIFWMVTRIDVHLHSGIISIYLLWLLLDVSAVSVLIVIIAICDMPRQEFSLCESVYIHNTYMKSRKSCSETRLKFWVKFPGRPAPNPSTIRRQAKRFKETGSIKNRKVNRRRHVLTEDTLDEIGERLGHTPQKSLKCLSHETGVSVSSVQRATTLLKLHIREYTHIRTMKIHV